MYIKVKVIAGAKKETIKKVGESRYEISVKEKAQMNMANNRIKEIIGLLFEINSKSVRIISGHQSPSKILSVDL